MYATYQKYTLEFKQPAGTSRGTLTQKESWFILLHNEKNGAVVAVGECGLLRGLSCDDLPDYQSKLRETCENINLPKEELLQSVKNYPSIRCGLEQAFLALNQKNKNIFFPSAFTRGEKSIDINGLIWMGKKEFMLKQIEEKLAAGFHCIKMKIGAVDFETELDCIRFIRSRYGPEDIQIRTDANGAFSPQEAPQKLEKLAACHIHSIEQPLKAGQISETAKLCAQNIIPIALDEELIGIQNTQDKEKLLAKIQPQYIILKPSLIGGFEACDEWIHAAKKQNAGFWITSALESNIGLNAISQYTAQKVDCEFPQGLGTGELYSNNLPGPCYIKNGRLHFDANFTAKPITP